MSWAWLSPPGWGGYSKVQDAWGLEGGTLCFPWGKRARLEEPAAQAHLVRRRGEEKGETGSQCPSPPQSLAYLQAETHRDRGQDLWGHEGLPKVKESRGSSWEEIRSTEALPNRPPLTQ